MGFNVNVEKTLLWEPERFTEREVTYMIHCFKRASPMHKGLCSIHDLSNFKECLGEKNCLENKPCLSGSAAWVWVHLQAASLLKLCSHFRFVHHLANWETPLALSTQSCKIFKENDKHWICMNVLMLVSIHMQYTGKHAGMSAKNGVNKRLRWRWRNWFPKTVERLACFCASLRTSQCGWMQWMVASQWHKVIKKTLVLWQLTG